MAADRVSLPPVYDTAIRIRGQSKQTNIGVTENQTGGPPAQKAGHLQTMLCKYDTEKDLTRL